MGQPGDTTGASSGPDGLIGRGRAKSESERLDWERTYSALVDEDALSPLSVEDLEVLATSAHLLGHVDDCVEALQRAHQLYVDAGDLRGAVRCGFWLVFNLFNKGDYSQGGGWLARITGLCDQFDEECAECGYPQIATAYRQIRIEGDYAEGESTARGALDLARRFGDADLLGLAQMLLGGALVRQELTREGLATLDETTVGVLTGEMSPVVIGLVYCSLIVDCEEIFAFDRALEWTKALTRWCDQQKGMVTFAGECLVHRATLKQLQGDWVKAVDQMVMAEEMVPNGADNRLVIGMMWYRRGELYRVRGEFTAAEDAYQRADEWGMDPQPGLALLRLAQGKTQVAVSAIRRAVGELRERSRRVRLLPAMVEIMLSAGEVEAARDAAAELAESATVFGTPGLVAEANQADGAVLLAEGKPSDALLSLRDAGRLWIDMGFPHSEARLRVLIAEACEALGDEETARMELNTARQIFSRLGAGPDLDRLNPQQSTSHGLSRRELEVLRLVAAGKTNQAIADELFISVKTVDRHVSNIFAKIGVSSRAAAGNYAHQHNLV